MTIFGRNGYSSSQARALKLFAPNYIQKVDGDSLSSYDFDSTSSFKTNPVGVGLYSTQQLNVDWSDLSKHTFFNSAQVKVNVSFDKVLNDFPFNGSQKDINIFIDSLTGYEKYVYDNFPKYKGYLYFSGTNVGEGPGGTYVITKDHAGAAYPGMSSRLDGKAILSPGYDSLTVEMHLYLPPISNSNQTVLDKHLGTTVNDIVGYAIGLQETGSLTTANLSMYILSGTVADQVSIPLVKGQWNHIAYVWDRTPGVEKIFGYVNTNFQASSSVSREFDYLTTSTQDLLIGSGSSLLTMFEPQTTFSGAIDELRIWHSVRSQSELLQYQKKNVYATDKLKLYYKFNEPQNVNSDVVIDYSPSSLHGRLSSTGYFLDVRNLSTSSIAGAPPMTSEQLSINPVLFPDYAEIYNTRATYLSSAAIFDEFNPNIITRLIPKHYLIDGLEQDIYQTQEGDIIENLQSGTDPRSSRVGGTQSLLLLLYTWAKFFDELKLYVQEFSNLYTVDYNINQTTPDAFLQFLGRQYGLELPSLFQDASLEQYFDGENVEGDIGFSTTTLSNVQNQIWRRILINMQDIIKSKGTLHSIKAYLRAIGIDPDNNFRIREYGGPNTRNLTWVRENKTETVKFINFVSGGLLTSNYILTDTANRTEPGWPYLDDATPTNNRLLTSGSWTYEGLYRFNSTTTDTTQSLWRANLSASAFFLADSQWLIGNIIYTSEDKKLKFVYCPDVVNSTTTLVEINDIDLYDGDPWYISVGRVRNDDVYADLNSVVSNSYFIRAAKNVNGEIFQTYTSSIWFQSPGGDLDQVDVGDFVFSIPQRPYHTIGSSSIPFAFFLSDTSVVTESLYRYSDFSGQVSQMRFWSKHLEDKEWYEHVRNFKSVGVQDPKTNWNFDTEQTGSFNRLRQSTEVDQVDQETDSLGQITFTDFSQNNFYYSGSSFLATSSNIITPYQMAYSFLSPNFDEGGTVNKIRIRSFEDSNNITYNGATWADSAPLYELPSTETPNDSNKFTIDFSIVDYLNQDIVTILSTLEELDNAIGSPELLYSSEYPSLDILRKNYFNKLNDKVNLKGFFEFYKWFDTNIGTFIAQLLPMKTKFVGTNYIIESHMLERSKMQYHSDEVYLGETNRNGLKGTLLVQLISGYLSRY